MFVLAAVAFTALVAVIICIRKLSAANAEKAAVSEQKAALANEKAVLESRLKSQEETFKALEEQRAEARLMIDEERKKAFESQRKQMEESFRLLSEQNSAGLRRQNAESITELLKPIKEKFGEFDAVMRTGQEKAAAQEASMREMIKALMEKSQSVSEEARNLANALTGHSKVQGDFGEMLLVDLLRSSGLEEGVHFRTQGVIRDAGGREIKSDSGATMIPDVIIYYPDDTELIIDSKVSLNAYMNYVNADKVEDRKRWAKEHVASVARHIDELKTKDYTSYIDDDRKKVDFNVMFIPMEGAFRLMLEEAPLLWQDSSEHDTHELEAARPGEEYPESLRCRLRAHGAAEQLDGVLREGRGASGQDRQGVFRFPEGPDRFAAVGDKENRQAGEAEAGPEAFEGQDKERRPHGRRQGVNHPQGAGRRPGRRTCR